MTNIDDDMRPAWPHKEITEADFRTIISAGMVERVDAKWEYTSEDTTREWLEVTSRDGRTTVLPATWPVVLEFVGYAHNPGLFKLNYLGERCEKTIEAIDAWEKKNAADRRAYERLKAKFEHSR